MNLAEELYTTAVTAFRAAYPGRGIGLQFGILGTASSILSVMIYTPRNHLSFLQHFGPKRYWLAAHMVLGFLGALLVSVHASLAWSRIPGLSNLAMWGTVASGIVCRYFSVKVPVARLKREYMLHAIETPAHDAMRKLDSLMNPKTQNMVHQAFFPALSFEEESRLGKIGGQFFRDVLAILILTTQVRRLGKSGRKERLNGPQALILMKHLVLTRHIILLKNVEAGAVFWRKLHIYLSIMFGALLIAHGLVVYLFKPRFDL